MSSRERGIDALISEAVHAAAGAGRRQDIQRRLEDLMGAGSRMGSNAGGPTGAFVDWAGRLASLAGPARAEGMTSWQGIVSQLNPIVGGLLRLFGGGGEAPTAELPAAVRAGRARYELGYAGSSHAYFPIDRDAGGLPRTMLPQGQPAVVVKVDAIDSRSFLERTPEIAEAVRRALLESEGMQSLFSQLQE